VKFFLGNGVDLQLESLVSCAMCWGIFR